MISFKVISRAPSEITFATLCHFLISFEHRLGFDAFTELATSCGFLNKYLSVNPYDPIKIPFFSEWKPVVVLWGNLLTRIVERTIPTHPPNTLDFHLEKFLVEINRNGFCSDVEKAGSDPAVLTRALDILNKHRHVIGDQSFFRLSKLCNKYTIPSRQKLDSVSLADAVSYPSAMHSKANEDQIRVTKLPRDQGQVTVMCDGISRCPNVDGTTTTGREAAIRVADSVRDFFSQYVFPDGFDPKNVDHLKELRRNFLDHISVICREKLQGIGASSTTLEVAIEFKGYLITLSIGDSGTMVVKPNGTCQMMNAAENYYRCPGDFAFHFSDEPTGKPSFIYSLVRDIRNPGGCIQNGFFIHHDQDSCGVSSIALEPGSWYVVYSDGLGDMTCNHLGNFESEQVDFLDLPRFWGILKSIKALGLSDLETAELFFAIAIFLSPKTDDITVRVCSPV
jgi:hypothetical protein